MTVRFYSMHIQFQDLFTIKFDDMKEGVPGRLKRLVIIQLLFTLEGELVQVVLDV